MVLKSYDLRNIDRKCDDSKFDYSFKWCVKRKCIKSIEIHTVRVHGMQTNRVNRIVFVSRSTCRAKVYGELRSVWVAVPRDSVTCGFVSGNDEKSLQRDCFFPRSIARNTTKIRPIVENYFGHRFAQFFTVFRDRKHVLVGGGGGGGRRTVCRTYMTRFLRWRSGCLPFSHRHRNESFRTPYNVKFVSETK